MRTKKSLLNISSNVLILLLRTILSFVVRTVFIKYLGTEMLGVNGLFTNILMMLSVTELGITSAINFSLYKPLADKDERKISILMSMYKRLYRIIGYITSVLGIILFFNLRLFIKEYDSINNVGIIYFIYLINTVSIYFLSYKETLIVADQNGYKTTKYVVCTAFFTYIIQIIVLIFTKSFIAYLVVEIFLNIIQRILINDFISKQYSNINFNSKEKLDKTELKDITKNVKALMIFKIGDYFINSTDNIILSKYIGIIAVGLYNNYYSLLTIVDNFIRAIFIGVTASLGNLVAIETDETKENTFYILNYISFALYGLVALEFYLVANDFIVLWIGKKYLLTSITVLFISIKFYIKGMLINIDTVRNVSGKNYKAVFVPIIEAILNIIFSVILAIKMGISGVFLGTILSAIPTMIIKPYIIYKHVFHHNVIKYYLIYFKQIIFVIVNYIIDINLIKLFVQGTGILSLLLEVIIIVIVFIIMILIFYSKTNEHKYICEQIRSKIGGMKNEKGSKS